MNEGIPYLEFHPNVVASGRGTGGQ